MKKKFLYLVAACLAGSYGAWAQLDPGCWDYLDSNPGPGCNNIIFDGGVEFRDAEPSNFGEVYKVCARDEIYKGTYLVDEQSVDYYTTGGGSGFTLANNPFGSVPPRRVGQQTVLGMVSSLEDLYQPPTNNYKEYIKMLYKNPLEIGRYYYAEVWVYKSCKSTGLNEGLTLAIGKSPNGIFGGGTHPLSDL